MTCPRCNTDVPHSAPFCHGCGADQTSASGTTAGRRHRYAVNPGEPVLSMNVVSSLMPLASQSAPQTYRHALLAGGAIPVIAVLLGWLPVAFAAAALLVPAVYLVYLYDVNEWEDQPVPVLGLSMLLAGALSFAFTLVWHTGWLPDEVGVTRASDGFSVRSFVVLCLAVPIIGELLRQIGPVLLARRRRFDDLIDAVTFGVAAGVTWAAVETFVVERSLIFAGPASVAHLDASAWWISILHAGVIKPTVYGSATAIAVAAYSGIGAGYDGLTRRYGVALGEAMGYGVAFQAGQFLAGRTDGGTRVLISLVTGGVVAAVAVLRVRMILHAALLESALEATLAGTHGQSAAHGEAFCGNCDMPLLEQAHFCSACGASVRSVPKTRRQFNTTLDGGAS